MWDKKIIAISDSQNTQGDFLNFIEKLGQSSIDALVLREKHLDELEYAKLAKEVLKIFNKTQKICFLHYHYEACLKLNHQFFHAPLFVLQNYPQSYKKFELLGTSIHSKEELDLAYKLKVSHAFFGHVFKSSCKTDLAPKGIKNLKDLLEVSKIPIYAIGGINTQTINHLKDLNLVGICIREALYKSENVKKYILRCKDLLVQKD
ncbi:thiamine phosphate synthase (TMP-TENI domain) [Campylobacter lari]|uniref:thiamine phosphate synthase n=1 Tax=Campylobacter lari TaxID=201 RepID=UPI001274B1BB|nr:thiamine phosphate synthase [Campylobacter lari]EAK0446684.1 thiamine phosphate synthase [Campylobacter lari]MBT0822214.1 thiamine phosphate synthase [Campylobacter lari]MBT0829937.1 thiamine phosphate synthase [Campylobacter lari]MCR6531567.1 thiamine phosphate synthase [Campylobacter lari]MCV3426005.1 thiamine phosphate synthase [Campylobacter lari]